MRLKQCCLRIILFEASLSPDVAEGLLHQYPHVERVFTMGQPISPYSVEIVKRGLIRVLNSVEQPKNGSRMGLTRSEEEKSGHTQLCVNTAFILCIVTGA